MKNIIREIPAEQFDSRVFFDDDTYTGNAGDYCYNLFILSFDHGRVYGFNTDEYERIQSQASEIADQFTSLEDGYLSCTYKDIMQDCGIEYSSAKCHKLKEWVKHYSPDDTDGIAAFLTITTGKQWKYFPCCGYSQGDYCDVIFCPEFNSAQIAQECGDIWLGCAKEFCVIELDEKGNEIDTCYGYFVADCIAWKDEQYKQIVCDQAGLNPEETQLEMIDGSHVCTVYDYRIA